MTVTLLSRELQVVYGSYTAGGSSGPNIDGFVSLTETWESAVVEFDFIIAGQASAAAFTTACNTAEAAFRLPRQALTISLGASTLKSYSHSGNTGFNAQPEIYCTKDDPAGSGRSRMYHVRVAVQLPASALSTGGRQSATIEIATAENRSKRVTISGVYTAVSGSSAKAAYDAGIGTFATAILTALGGEYNLEPEQVEFDDAATSGSADTGGKILRFTRVYQEIIYSEVGASLNDTSVIRQTFILSRTTSQPGDSPFANVRRIDTIDVSWSAIYDKTVTQALVSKYATAKAWILSQVRSKLSLAVLALVDEKVDYDWTGNMVTSAMKIHAVVTGSVLRYMVTEGINIQPGQITVPAWTGNPLEKFVYDGPSVIMQTVAVEVEELGVKPASSLVTTDAIARVKPAIPAGIALGNAVQILKSASVPASHVERRGQDVAQFDVTVSSGSMAWEVLVPLQVPVAVAVTPAGTELLG